MVSQTTDTLALLLLFNFYDSGRKSVQIFCLFVYIYITMGDLN